MDGHDAFISYSHAADGRLAPAVRQGLERLAKPWRKRRALRVFQDTTGLSASPALWTSIKSSLDSARYFVLLASPAAAASDWVGQELEHFLSIRSTDRMLVALTDGTCRWDTDRADFDWEASTALPRPLQGAFSEEPLYIDLRWAREDHHLDLRNARFREAIANLAAPIHGVPKDELDTRDLIEHRRARRARRAATAGLGGLATAAAVAGWVAVDNAQQAEREERRATASAAEAIENARTADAQRLAALSIGYADEQTDLAILLALHSLERRDTREGNVALATAMTRPAAATEVLPGSEDGALDVSVDERVQVVAALSGGIKGSRRTDGSIGEVIVWDAATSQVRSRRLATVDRDTVALSPDGQKVVFLDPEGRLTVGSATDPDPSIFQGPTGVESNAFSPDGSLLVSSSAAGVVTIRSTEQYQTVATVTLPDDAPVRPSFTNDGSMVAVGSSAGQVTLLRPDGTVIRSWSTGHEHIATLVVSPSGHRVAVGSSDGLISIWDSSSGELIQQLAGHQTDVLGVAYAPDEESLASAGADGTVRLWDMGSAKPIGQLTGHDGSVGALAFGLDGHTLFSGGSDALQRWDLSTGRPEWIVTGNSGVVGTIAFSPDSSRYATEAGKVMLWESEADASSGTIDALSTSVAYSPDGRSLAVAGSDGQVSVYDALTAKLRTKWSLDGPLWNLAYAPDGTSLAVAGENGTVTLVDLESGSQRTFRKARAAAYDVTFAPDGRTLVTSAFDGSVTVWDVRSGEPITEMEVPTFRSGEAPIPIALSPDGTRLAVGAADGSIRVFDPSTGEELLRIRGHKNRVYDVAFSPDGSLIASGGFNGGGVSNSGFDAGLRLWDTSTGQQIAEFVAHDSQVEAVTFSPDGRWLASGGADKQVLLWPGPHQWLERSCAVARRDLTEDERRSFLQPDARDVQVCRK